VTWPLIASGFITLPEIPLVMFFTNERKGNYYVKPPLVDLAKMNLEIFRSLAREEEILTFAGSPMLVGNGVSPPKPTQIQTPGADGVIKVIERPASKLKVGPRTILYAPPGDGTNKPSWDYIQPQSANIVAIQQSTNDKIAHFRRLALQPQTTQSGDVSATSEAIAAGKAQSAVQVWANTLKDCLEQLFVFTCQWYGMSNSEVEVSVHTDFAVDVLGDNSFSQIQTMRGRRDISQKTLWIEGQRRGILGPQFDPDQEELDLADEAALMGEQNIDPNTGQPVPGSPSPGGG